MALRLDQTIAGGALTALKWAGHWHDGHLARKVKGALEYPKLNADHECRPLTCHAGAFAYNP